MCTQYCCDTKPNWNMFPWILKIINEPETQATKENSVHFIPRLFDAFSQKDLDEKLQEYFLCWKYGGRSNHKVNLFKKLQRRWQEATAIAEQTRRKEKWNENIKQENWVFANSSKISYWGGYPHFCIGLKMFTCLFPYTRTKRYICRVPQNYLCLKLEKILVANLYYFS